MREVTVGTIVIVAIVVFIFGTMWLSGRSVSSSNTVRLQFANVSGLKRASPVRISGVSVGKVERIEFQDVGKVLVTASLPPKIKPRVDASATIVSVTLVGDYAVDLDPGRAAELLQPGRVILGTQDAGLSGRAMGLTDRADSVLIGAQAIVNQKTADQLSATMNALQATLKAATKGDGDVRRSEQGSERRTDAHDGESALGHRTTRQHPGEPCRCRGPWAAPTLSRPTSRR